MSSDRAAGGVPLAPLTTLGVGGPARWFIRATTIEEVAAAHAGARTPVPLFVLGGGSNLVVADGGFEGLVLQVAIGGIDFRAAGTTTVFASAPVSLGRRGGRCVVPGARGPRVSVGHSRQHRRHADPERRARTAGGAGTIAASRCSIADRQVDELTARGCRFGYRTSRFKADDAGRFVVCEVTFHLAMAPPTLAYPDVISDFERRGIPSPTSPMSGMPYCRFGGGKAWSSTRRIRTRAASDRSS